MWNGVGERGGGWEEGQGAGKEKSANTENIEPSTESRDSGGGVEGSSSLSVWAERVTYGGYGRESLKLET